MNQDSTQQDKAKDHKNISFTADTHVWFRVLYEIPYAKDLADFYGINAQTVADKMNIAPIFEARCKGTDSAVNRYIREKGITQVLSLGAGLEMRGILTASQNPNLTYVETDISEPFQRKSEVADLIFDKYSLPNRSGLKFETANLTKLGELEKALAHFNKNKPLIIVNEGVLAYYSEAENREIAGNIRNILGRFGGTWITSDPSLNKVNRRILFSYVPNMKETVAQIAQKTGRHYDELGFEDNLHAERFFESEGFSVRRYNSQELGYELKSLRKVGLDEETMKKAEHHAKEFIKAWAMTLKK